MKRVYLVAAILIGSSSVFAWSGDGHRVIAQIAYDNLTPKAKQEVDKLTLPEGEQYLGRGRFIYISTWADRIRFQGDHRFDKWHYISLPISVDNAPTKPAKQKNAVYAIEEAKKVLSDDNASEATKLLYLKLLVHFVGDIHQPLHCVNRYTWTTPNGDLGGNTYLILNANKKPISLHSYWDSGLGLFKLYNRQHAKHSLKIIQVAKLLEIKYYYLRKDIDTIGLPTMTWAMEGQQISSNFAYTIKRKSRPNIEYVEQGRRTVEKRVALAGFRLADVLNHLYSTQG